MRLVSLLDSLVARFFRRSRTEDDIQAELRAHIQYRADHLEQSGLDRVEAERLARLEFGGTERIKEEVRDTFFGSFLETLIQDLRYSMRVLRKSPGFVIVATVTLALAIGANSVVFGILDGLILRPLNVPDPESLYMIEHVGSGGQQSYPDYIDLRDRNRSFDGLAAYNVDAAGLDTGDSPSRVWVYLVSGNYFDVLRLQPFIGRFIHASDEHGPNSVSYIVLTHTYWLNHFQGDRGVIGRTVLVNKHPFTIVGVTPPGFHGTLIFGAPDFFIPMINEEQVDGVDTLNARGNHWVFAVIGHLKPGVTTAQAASDLNSIGAYLEKTYPKDDGHVNLRLARPSLYGNFLGPSVRAFVTGLMILAGLILLAACANLGNLFAARAADRSREIALRLALGARRSRILRTLFTEALIISLIGGAFGLWGSVALLQALSVWRPVPRFPVFVPVGPDASVLLVALILALVSGILFGVVPVRQVLRVDPYQVVKSGTTGAVGRRFTPRDLLLAAQIAICAVLVTSSLVAVRGLMRSMSSDFGFDRHDVIVLNTEPSMAGYHGDAAATIQQRLIRSMESIPGVESVGLVDEPPLYGGGHGSYVYHEESADLRPANSVALPYRFIVSPDYLRAAGTPLLAGRSFTWHDDANSPRVAVINRELAVRLFGSAENVVGRYFKLRDGARVQVVGLVGNGKYWSLTESSEPAIFVPILQMPTNETWLMVRSHRDPGQLASEMKSKVRDLDRGLPMYLATWDKEVQFALFPAQMATFSLGVMGMLGAMLSVTGIFGMAAYSVSKRLKELGIRLALGAGRKQVLQAALGRSVKLLAIGSAAGLALGLLAARVLAFIVYQATPRDPLVLTGVVVAMLLLGLIATWIPAQRALQLDPLKLLREE